MNSVSITIAGLLLVSCVACNRAAQSTLEIPFDSVFTEVSRTPLVTNASEPIASPADLTEYTGGIAIADPQNHNVKVFDRFGHLTATIGKLGSGPGEFSGPVSVTKLGDRLAILDGQAMSVSELDTTFHYIRRFAFPGFLATRIRTTPDAIIIFARSGGGDRSGLATLDEHYLMIGDTMGSSFKIAGTLPRAPGHNVSSSYGDVVGRFAVVVQMAGNLVMQYDLKRAVQDTFRITAGYTPPDWNTSMQGGIEGFDKWARGQTWTTGVIPMDSLTYLVQMTIADSLFRYAIVDAKSRRQTAVTEQTPVNLLRSGANGFYGMILNDSTQTLVTYRRRLNPN